MAREWNNDGRNKKNQRFGTVDGEGANIDDVSALFGTTHEYLLLRADEFQVTNLAGLSYRECFDFLNGLPRNRIWTGYFFDYDVTMMCRQLTEERARRLFDPTLRQNAQTGFSFASVDVDDTWEIGYIPHKEFKVRRKGTDSFTVISDTGQFFQSSFVRTLQKWNIGTHEEQEQIIKGKGMRADFTGITEEINDYNALECVLHDQLMEQFRNVCVEIGYVPKKWQGPGHLASAMLAKHGVPKRDEIPIMGNWKFRELANAAYYGGRAETTAIGHIPGPIYQWDINGAYVDALRKLPCLIHGSWKYVKERPKSGVLWVGDISFGHSGGRLLYNLPVRKADGNIFFPRFGSGHYWSWEVESAEYAGTSISEFRTGWIYEPHCKCTPFSWIDAYYLERLRLGKSGKGIVLKLGGNSIYGKIAQSVGYAPWANPVWAGLITAYCRAKIIQAYASDVNDVLMIMTDGLFMRHKPNLSVSQSLGDWELKEHANLFIVQPGIYFLPDSVKTRGVPLGRIQAVEGEFRDAFAKFAQDFTIPEAVPIPVDNFLTMRQALARRKWRLAGTWEHTTRDISFDWTNKRKGSGIIRESETGVLRTFPHDSDVSVISVPYDRVIGGQMNLSPFDRYSDPGLLERQNADEQPDWNEPLIGEELCPKSTSNISVSAVYERTHIRTRERVHAKTPAIANARTATRQNNRYTIVIRRRYTLRK